MPNKSLGQHFLRDKKILSKIANFAQINEEDTVVEIGPGEGTLTEILLEKASRVIAIEKDENLAQKLQGKFEEKIKNNKLMVVVGDILTYKLQAKSYKLVGNIPYYITGAILQKFLESANQPESLTFVIQKEVAERILSRDGKESILSLSIKAYGKPVYGGIVKAGSFYPRPKVDSAIIAIRDVSKQKFTSYDVREKNFFFLIKKGFSHKRKLLIKNLGLEKQVFEKLKILENIRAEDLEVDKWFLLAREPML